MARGPALDVRAQIGGRVAAQPGKVWTPVDFLDLGPRATVDKSLQRLTADEKLFRIGRGLYYRAGTNTLTRKPTTPDVRAIVDAIARRHQSRIVVDGLTAANDLGLTTAVPARVTVLTDARLRPIKMAKQRIVFQTVAPRRLYWAGRPAMRIVQALYWLKDLLDSDNAQILQRLRAILADPAHGDSIRDDLQRGLPRCPPGCSRSSANSSRHGLEQSPPPTERNDDANEAYSQCQQSGDAVLVGQSEPDVPGRNTRELHVVSEAERERSPQPVLREHAGGVAWRRRVLVL